MFKRKKVITMVKLSLSPPHSPWIFVLLRKLRDFSVRVSGLGELFLWSVTSWQLQRLVNLCSSCPFLFPFLVNQNHEKSRNRS